MKRIAIIILLLLGSRYEGYCQFIESAGPNSTALAGLNANNADVWSINYNVGQLQNLERSSIAVSFHQPFLLSDFTTANMVLAICTKRAHLVSIIQIMGMNIFKSTQLVLDML